MSLGFRIIKGNINYYGARLAEKFHFLNPERGAVRIHDLSSVYGNAGEQLFGARDIISNFARKNNLSVDIYDARHLLDDCHYPLEIENSLSNKIQVVVKDIKTGKTRSNVIDADTEIIYNRSKDYKRTAIVPGEETIAVRGEFNAEDTFIRNIYCVIESLANQAKYFNK